MQSNIEALALRRAGFSSLRQFMEARSIQSQQAAREALMPWVLGYDLWRVRPGDTYSRIARETGGDLQALIAANPQYPPENLRVGAYVVVPMNFPVTALDTAFTWELCHYTLRGLQARYPFLRCEVIGQTAYGRPLELATAGSGDRTVCLNASHHANEWITTPLVLCCLELLLRAASRGESLLGEDAAALLRRTRLHLLPMVNPDGVDLVNGVLRPTERSAAEAIARDYPDIPFPEGWKANLRGVDLNLNYPALWDQGREVKYQLGFTSPAPRDFVGPEPLSENETRALFDLTERENPDLVAAWHTQGEVIYWKFQDIEPQGAGLLGRQMAQSSGYALEDVPYASSFGGYKDWFIQDFRRPGYTVEAGLGDNPLPLSQLPEMVEKNLPIFLLCLTGGDPDFRAPNQPVAAASSGMTVLRRWG